MFSKLEFNINLVQNASGDDILENTMTLVQNLGSFGEIILALENLKQIRKKTVNWFS